MIDSKLLQKENALFLILITEYSSENTISSNFLQLKNSYSLIDSIDFGIIIVPDTLHSENE